MPPQKGYIPMKWSEIRERELLLRIIAQVAPSPSTIDWAKIAEPMGEDSTEAACKLKYGKLKKIADDLGATTGQGGGKGKTTKAKGSKKRKAAEDDGEEDTPKVKKVDTKSEEDDGDGLI